MEEAAAEKAGGRAVSHGEQVEQWARPEKLGEGPERQMEEEISKEAPC